MKCYEEMGARRPPWAATTATTEEGGVLPQEIQKDRFTSSNW